MRFPQSTRHVHGYIGRPTAADDSDLGLHPRRRVEADATEAQRGGRRGADKVDRGNEEATVATEATEARRGGRCLDACSTV
jgi:hypothetical protein